MSVKQVISETMAERGFFGFYRGLSSMLYFAAPKAAIRFSSFEFFSGLLTDANGGDKYGLGQAKGFLAGLGAGTMEAIFVTTPQETIKIKLIHDQVRLGRRKGFPSRPAHARIGALPDPFRLSSPHSFAALISTRDSSTV